MTVAIQVPWFRVHAVPNSCVHWMKIWVIVISFPLAVDSVCQPQNIVPPGKDQLQRATALRQEALVERNSAAVPYICIARHCLVCKRQGAA